LDDFRCLVSERLTLTIALKTEEHIEAATKFFSDTFQCAGWNAMLEHKRILKAYCCLIIIKQKIEEKQDFVENCTSYEHLLARDYITQDLKKLINNNKK
jgi:hypothetical protein